MENINDRLSRIEELLLSQKTVLSFDEAAVYTNFSKSYLYKLTSSGGIPCYKPQGKNLYFNKIELDQWLQRNRVKPTEEIAQEASTHVALGKR